MEFQLVGFGYRLGESWQLHVVKILGPPSLVRQVAGRAHPIDITRRRYTRRMMHRCKASCPAETVAKPLGAENIPTLSHQCPTPTSSSYRKCSFKSVKPL